MSQFPPQSPPPPPPPPPPPGGGGYPVSGGNQPADATSAISYGWKKFQEHWQGIIVALIIGFVAIVVLAIIGTLIRSSLTSVDECKVNVNNGVIKTSGCGGGPSFFVQLLASALLQFLIFLGSCVLQLFIIRATLKIVRGEPFEASTIMTTENLGPYVIGAIIVGILTFVGFILCIIPGILVAFFTMFWGYFIIDKNMSPTEAITASFNLVKEHAGAVIIFLILSWVVLFIGAILCGIGLFVAWPVVIIATGYMYKRLQGEPVAA